MKNRFLIIASITVIVLCFFSFGIYKKNKSTQEKSSLENSIDQPDFNTNVIVSVDVEDFEENKSYLNGYKKGFDAFLSQEKIESIPNLTIEYSVLEDKSQNNEDDEMKGYIDGYHKASNSMHCPRCTYH